MFTKWPKLQWSWDYSKNSIDPKLGHSSHEKYWWLCKKKHSYQRIVSKELVDGCGVCSGHIVSEGQNDFKTVCEGKGRLDILAQWDYEKNTLKPTQITANSNQKAYWICKEKHKWEAQVGGRWIRGCPGCSRKRLEIGYNDLETHCKNNPKLAHIIDEWDHEKNLELGLTLSTVTARAGKYAYWRCTNNHGWRALVSNRTAGDSCPTCRVSKLEKDIESYIRTLTEATLRKDRSILEGKEIDIYIEELNIGFEVNGDFWHSESYMKRNGKAPAIYHKAKRELALEKNVTLLFVWESDWKQNKSLVKDAIRRVIVNKADIDSILTILTKG